MTEIEKSQLAELNRFAKTLDPSAVVLRIFKECKFLMKVVTTIEMED